MKKLLTIFLLLLAAAGPQTVFGQDQKPFIPSGMILDSAIALYDSGSYRQAIDALRQIDRNDTNYVKALYNIGLCYYADSQYQKSLYYNQQALACHADPEEEPDLLNQIGNSVDAAGETLQAIPIFDSALRKYPGYSLLSMNKGTMLFKLKRYAEAEAVFKQTLLIDPFSYSSHYKLGICALNQGKLVPAMLCFVGYLLVDPEGRYHNSCITMLKAIANNTDFIQDLVNTRKETPSEAYQLLEQILQSKIALDNNYKLLAQPDDPILRQIQVLFEKMQYDPADSDFYMQYYIPHFKACFDRQQFQFFINQAFSGVDIPVLDASRKRNRKEMTAFVDTIAAYFNQIRQTRELNFLSRDTTSWLWTFNNGKLSGHGKYLEKEQKFVGPWEFYYTRGNLRAKGLYNDQGKQEGTWVYYYFDGQIRAKINFINGQQTDLCTWYFKDGTISSKTFYRGDLAEGESVSYYLTGTPNQLTHYRADKEEGLKIGFFDNGDTSYIENYSAGVLNGPIRTWYRSRQLESDYQMVNGKWEGAYVKYFENGRIASQGNYSKDLQDGNWKTYYSTGQLKTEQNFVSGKLDGDGKEYNENGTVSETYSYKRGKIEGDLHYYDDDGKQFAVFQYEKGLLQHATYYDKSGKPLSQSQRDKGRIDLSEYYPDGPKRMVGAFNANDNLTGVETFYYPSGQTEETDEYVDGDEEGASLAYYPDGKPKTESYYSGGKLNGFYKSYYATGQPKEQGWYRDNEACGAWLSYNDLGSLTDSIFYSDGAVTGYKESFSPDGRKQSEYNYKQGWLQEMIQYDSNGNPLGHLKFPGGTGKYQLIYPDGRVMIDGRYVRGKLDGLLTVYYPDGKEVYHETYVRGDLEGTFRNYFHSGGLASEGQYSHGEKTGTWKYYFTSGKLKSTEDYSNGKLNGKEVDYYETGQIETTTVYVDDMKTGPFSRYDPDGTLLYEIMDKGNIPVSYTWLDKNGNKLPAVPIVAQAGKIKTVFPNGNVAAEMEYKDGSLTGPVRLYYTNGKLRKSYSLQGGNLTGPYTRYYSNGQIEAEYSYYNDNLHGDYKVYNEKGVVTEIGKYYDGSLHGITRIYDDHGNLKETYVYYYGTLLSVK
jgi:antitoxin component YwqK of YwqJK toxin-antitoxin module/tetratricopeptide (TPR) repeat protein